MRVDSLFYTLLRPNPIKAIYFLYFFLKSIQKPELLILCFSNFSGRISSWPHWSIKIEWFLERKLRLFIKKTANIWLPILFVLVLVGATFANLRLASAFQLQDDFAPRWMAAREWMRSGASPYSESTFNATIDLLKANGNEPSSMSQGRFFDPAWYVLFYLPISFVPYTIARAIWMTFIELSLVLSVFISIRLAGLKLSVWEILLMSFLALVFYPFFKTILTVSVNTPYVFLTLLAVYLARNRQEIGRASWRERV